MKNKSILLLLTTLGLCSCFSKPSSSKEMSSSSLELSSVESSNVSSSEEVISSSASSASSASSTIPVVHAESITLNKNSLDLLLGDTFQLSYEILPSNVTDKSVTVTNSDPSIAEIDSSLVITAKKKGITTITVSTKNGKSDSIKVNVDDNSKTKIKHFVNEVRGENVGDSCMPTKGNPKLLIIPIWFEDSSEYIDKINKNAILEDLNTTFFGTEQETGWNSVRTYYETESNNTCHLSGTISNWYSCGEKISDYYTDKDITKTPQLVLEATDWYFSTHLDDNPTNYDFDHDGYLDGVVCIFGCPDLGYVYEDYNKDNLWPYVYNCYLPRGTAENPEVGCFMWASYGSMYPKDTYIDYFGKDESSASCNYAIFDAHTYIHETGHLFGLEDIYDTTFYATPTGGFSMQDLAYGSHDPFSTMILGWSDPYIPTQTCEIELNDFNTSHEVILLTNKWNEYDSPFDEYLLLELFAPTGLAKEDIKTGNYTPNRNRINDPTAVGIRLWHVDARLIEKVDGEWDGNFFTLPRKNCNYAFVNTKYQANIDKSIYGSYNLTQMIRNDPEHKYHSVYHYADQDLFKSGDKFSQSTYASQFMLEDKMNKGEPLKWTFEVGETSETSTGYKAKIKLTHLD